MGLLTKLGPITWIENAPTIGYFSKQIIWRKIENSIIAFGCLDFCIKNHPWILICIFSWVLDGSDGRQQKTCRFMEEAWNGYEGLRVWTWVYKVQGLWKRLGQLPWVSKNARSIIERDLDRMCLEFHKHNFI